MSFAKAEFHIPLDRKYFSALANALGDTPTSTIEFHLLKRHLCDVHAACVPGERIKFHAAVIRPHPLPDELSAYGQDAVLIRKLLGEFKGWRAVEVDCDIAQELKEIIERDPIESIGKKSVRLLNDIFFVLTRPVNKFSHESVRLMTPDDLYLVESSEFSGHGDSFGSTIQLLTEGIVACGVVRDDQGGEKPVSMANTFAISNYHVDIGVVTLSEWRHKGLACAAASLVAEKAQALGYIPVWSTGENNLASQNLAKKLGFTEVSKRTYLIMD